MAQKRVLIVDDEEDLTWSISKHLARDRDKYELIAVNSGMAALDVLAQVPVDLVITDIRMPEISGLDLLLKIRENYPQTKVVIMTAYGSSEIQEEANRRGCFKYIEKPFEIQELRQLILNVLQDKRGFEGRISDFQLSDLIQLLCLGRQTNSLHFEKDGQRGVIFFEDGNIVHAEVEGIEGEEAFYEILTWDGGSFTLHKGEKPPRESIFKGWQSLLLEGLRRLDEARARENGVEMEEDNVQQKIIDILDEFTSTSGIILAAITDENGFVIASSVSETYREKYNVAEIVTLIEEVMTHAHNTGEQLALGLTEEIILQYQHGVFRLLRTSNPRYFFVTITEIDLTLSLLRIESKKVIKQLQPFLKQL